jgi:transcriptional regulator with XRE-family HTH domain
MPKNLSSLHSDANITHGDNAGMAHVGTRVKARRKELGLKQVDVARLVGITQPSLSLIESGDTKSLRGMTLVGLARALRTSTRWVMTGKGPHELAPQLSEQEETLLNTFLSLTDANRQALLAAAKALEQSQPEPSEE